MPFEEGGVDRRVEPENWARRVGPRAGLQRVLTADTEAVLLAYLQEATLLKVLLAEYHLRQSQLCVDDI